MDCHRDGTSGVNVSHDGMGGLKTGKVVSIRGSVIDARFSGGVPLMYSELRTGPDEHIVLEVVSLLDEQTVRGIALTPTQGLTRGRRFVILVAPCKSRWESASWVAC